MNWFNITRTFNPSCKPIIQKWGWLIISFMRFRCRHWYTSLENIFQAAWIAVSCKISPRAVSENLLTNRYLFLVHYCSSFYVKMFNTELFLCCYYCYCRVAIKSNKWRLSLGFFWEKDVENACNLIPNASLSVYFSEWSLLWSSFRPCSLKFNHKRS